MKNKWDAVFAATLVICALVTTALVVHREFFSASTASTGTMTATPVFIQDWKSHLKKGVLLGPAGAPIQLVEFSDFECPFCGDFHKNLKILRERYPTQVSLTYVHFPLPGHRFAIPAARVAECAGEQGRFETMHDRLFDGQESFGLKPWTDYAAASGVPDLAAFEMCIKRDSPFPRIEEGRQLGAKLDVKGTPTLIVNGWMLGRPPTAEELDGMVKAVLAGNSPVAPGKS